MSNANTPDRTALLLLLTADMVCAGCKGKGKRGRGFCSACRGTGETDLCASPRVKFNSGFHDAIAEFSRFGTQRNPDGMSVWYGAGYRMGLICAWKGETPTRSSEAWTSLTGLDDDLKPGVATLMAVAP